LYSPVTPKRTPKRAPFSTDIQANRTLANSMIVKTINKRRGRMRANSTIPWAREERRRIRVRKNENKEIIPPRRPDRGGPAGSISVYATGFGTRLTVRLHART
jgi:hypothetical protein